MMNKTHFEGIDEATLAEKVKFIEENLRRAGSIQDKIGNMETIKSFEKENRHVIRVTDIRNCYIERNEYLNQIVQELGTMGFEVAFLRPWQKDVRVQMNAIVQFFNALKTRKAEKKEEKVI